MSTPTPGTGYGYASVQTAIGLAKEATRGTAVAPTLWMPVKAPKYKPDIQYIPDDTLQGSMVQVNDLIRGLRYDGHGWDSFPYLDTFPALLIGELGSPDTMTAAGTATTLSTSATVGAATVSCTATVAADSYITIGSGGSLETHYVTSVTGSGPYVATLQAPLFYNQPSGATVTPLTEHTFSLLNNAGQGNQPPSYTITDFDGEEWRQLTACQLDELNLKGNVTGLVDYTCTWFGNPATTPTTPTESYTGESAPAGWTAVCLIDGTQVYTLEDWEWNMKRNVKPVPALIGTVGYFMYFASYLDCTGKLTFIEQSGSPYLADFESGTSHTLDITMFDQTQGAAMNLHSSKVIFKTGELDRSQEYVRVPLEFDALPTSTDATAGGKSPVKITVANQVTTAF